jgi:hypothetical protein
MNESKCVICGEATLLSRHESACAGCKATYPAPLVKACCNHESTYALGLRNGKTFLFSGARIIGDWVYLQADSKHVPARIVPGLEMDTSRGAAVRVDDIMWCLEGGR